jgi:photosystem II stability/assembly factor-like uncharacterized protein
MMAGGTSEDRGFDDNPWRKHRTSVEKEPRREATVFGSPGKAAESRPPGNGRFMRGRFEGNVVADTGGERVMLAEFGPGATMGLLAVFLVILSAGSPSSGQGKPTEPAKFALPSSPDAARRHDAWIVIGPGGGGAQYFPTISPVDPKIVCVRCDMTGAYISRDGGESWRMFNLRSPASFFVLDPVDVNVMYAYASGLWRSTDGGDSWNLVYPKPENVRDIIVNGDHGDWSFALREDGAGQMRAMAIDPADPRVLYALISTGRQMRLFKSSDSGKTWTDLRGLANGGQKIYVDPRSPKDDRTMYVIGESSVSVREKGKWTDHEAPQGVEHFGDASLGFPADGGRAVIYAVSAATWRGQKLIGGILVSRDGGESWVMCTDDFAKEVKKPATSAPSFRAIATCLTQPDIAYVSYKNLRGDEDYFGVAKTSDGGRTWVLAVKNTAEKPSPNEKDAHMDVYWGPSWGDYPAYLVVAPDDPNLCYGTDDGRTMRTTDGLKTWVGVYSKKLGNGWSTTGLDVTTCYGVHRDPHDTLRLFISYTDIGLWRSEDGGTSWVHSTDGLPREWWNTTYWLEFDPDVKRRCWAGVGANHDLPRPKMWRNMPDVSHYRGGVVISTDGGRTWEKVAGMSQTDVTHIVVDRKSPADRRVLYAAGFGTGVWKSTDCGRTWTLKRQGLPGKEPFAWRLAMDSKGVLYVILARRSDDGSFGNELDGALYRSADGAESWERVKLPPGVNGPNGLSIDPDDPGRMVLAVWGRQTSGEARKGAADGGIFLTTDGGNTWKNVFNRNQYIYDVTTDPRNPNILYACGFESSAWRSDDRGKTWYRLKGFNFKWGHRVIPDPINPEKIFVTTFGGSVWYGPARGDPNAREDIATPNVGYGIGK